MTTHSFLSGAPFFQGIRDPFHTTIYLASSNSEISGPPHSSPTSSRRSTMVASIAALFLTHPLPPELAARACRQGEEPTREHQEVIEE